MNRSLLLAAALLPAAALCGLAAGSGRPKPKPATVEATALATRYCLTCHSAVGHAGDLNLEPLVKTGGAAPDAKVWQKVAEMLDNGEMPPKSAPQPSKSQRAQIREWVKRRLDAMALATAGDPGPVVMRRLNNAEYTYTVRDLTGLDLSPAREFPADSAAGEGFTNTGNSLVMSPALLTKYFDAGKEIAKHAELLPDGFRFSPAVTRNDSTNDLLARIRAFYALYADSGGASQVNLQGIVFATNEGGRLPIERYLKAALVERAALASGRKAIAAVAKEQALNAKYLGILWSALNGHEPSLLLDTLRARWRSAGPADAAALTSAVAAWQKALWKFSTVGHIGRAGGPKAWQEPVDPIAPRQEVRVRLEPAPGQKEVSVYLVSRDPGAGLGSEHAVWRQPRLVAPGRPDLPLRDVRLFSAVMSARRAKLFASTAATLAAVSEAERASGAADVDALARSHGVDAAALTAWLDYLGIGASPARTLAHFTNRMEKASAYAFIQGWGAAETPLLVANSSDEQVRIPGTMKPHGVCVHPSPTLDAAVGWQSPIAGAVRVEAVVTHAHPECGNGVTWSLEVRHGATRRRLASGAAQGPTPVVVPPVADLHVQPGDLVSLLIGPRNGDHGCDLTDLQFVLKGADGREWSLTRDVSGDVLAGNPHADRYGNAGVWHFYTEPDRGGDGEPVVPAGSLLARWQEATDGGQRQQLAAEIQSLLTAGPPAGQDEKSPDVRLYRQLASLGGPLLVHIWRRMGAGVAAEAPAAQEATVGLDPALFGKSPGAGGTAVEPTSLCVQSPSVTEVRIPAELAAGAELVTAGEPLTADGRCAQMQVLTARPADTLLDAASPLLAAEGSAARSRLLKGFEEFRRVFPAALCYTKIVPVDEVVTLTLFYREDDALKRLMLDAAEARKLDRLWDELHFVSQDALKLVNAYEQITEFATQDAPAMVIALKPMRKPIMERAEAFRQAMVAAEPRQVDALIDFAARAYRRPLTPAEEGELRGLYRQLRSEELPHDEAFRLTLAKVFVSPAFLYRLERAPVTAVSAAVTDWELANRLSYFLWSSQPDAALRAAVSSGALRTPAGLRQQMQRMLRDPRVRRLATEFACQWLHIYDFDALDEKSEKFFPEFAGLRADLYEESIRFFTDAFQNDETVLSLFDTDHTFVNERVAKFYGIPGVSGADWRRVDGVRRYGRGGILALSTTLAKQSGASRTSPILRGNWISEVLLGEKLPRPPKSVPRLPEDETATEGLTVRQLVTKHTSDPRCAGCHRRIDPFGFSLEAYDAIGRRRTVDMAKRPIDTKTTLPDGSHIDGLPGLRNYLINTRRSVVVRQFCRKLLGYALGRATQLSDETLLTRMQSELARNRYRISTAVDLIVQSRQFREIRGKVQMGHRDPTTSPRKRA